MSPPPPPIGTCFTSVSLHLPTYAVKVQHTPLLSFPLRMSSCAPPFFFKIISAYWSDSSVRSCVPLPLPHSTRRLNTWPCVPAPRHYLQLTNALSPSTTPSPTSFLFVECKKSSRSFLSSLDKPHSPNTRSHLSRPFFSLAQSTRFSLMTALPHYGHPDRLQAARRPALPLPSPIGFPSPRSWLFLS